MTKAASWILSCALLAGGCTSSTSEEEATASSADRTAPTSEWSPCAELECLTIELDGPSTVRVSRIPRPGRQTAAIVFDPGGPGVRGDEQLAGLHNALGGEALGANDLITVDFVNPPAPNECLDATERALSDGLDQVSGDGGWGTTCGRGHHNDRAGTIEHVRAVLGYESISFLTISYGSVTALDYAARYPRTTGRLVLDSPVDPRQTWRERLESSIARVEAAGEEAGRLCDPVGSACNRVTTAGGAVPVRSAELPGTPVTRLAERVMTTDRPDRGLEQVALIALLQEWPSSEDLLAQVFAEPTGSLLRDIGRARMGVEMRLLADLTAARYLIECRDLVEPPSTGEVQELIDDFVGGGRHLAAIVVAIEAGCAGSPGRERPIEVTGPVDAVILFSNDDLVISPAQAALHAETLDGTQLVHEGTTHGLIAKQPCAAGAAHQYLSGESRTALVSGFETCAADDSSWEIRTSTTSR